MKNTKISFKINIATYFLILTFLLTGLIKNIILIYLIIIIHELGHVLVIRKLKYKILKVEIYPMGGITSIDKKINSKINDELKIAIAGILSQILLSLIFYLFFKNNRCSTYTYELFKNYNKTIILFNLLPIIPLDGYLLLRSLLEKVFPYHKVFYISFFISIVCILLFITINELYSLNNYLIISFLIYKMYDAYKNHKYVYNRFLTERYIYKLPYQKLKYENGNNLKLLKKDTYHYFKTNDKVYSEYHLLAKKFDKKL